MYINQSQSDPKVGFYLSAAVVLLGSLSLGLVDVHKRRLRRRKHLLQHSRSILSTSTMASGSSCPAHPRPPAGPPPPQQQQLSGNGSSLILLGGSASSAAGVPIGVHVAAAPPSVSAAEPSANGVVLFPDQFSDQNSSASHRSLR